VISLTTGPQCVEAKIRIKSEECGEKINEQMDQGKKKRGMKGREINRAVSVRQSFFQNCGRFPLA